MKTPPKTATLPMQVGIVCAALVISDATAREAAPVGPCEREMIRAARQYSVPLQVLYSVALTESSRKKVLQPFAMNIDGKSYFASTSHEAVEQFYSAKGRGARFIDLGCMQINHRFHSHKFKSVEEMLLPHKNVDYAASFLKELFGKHGSWTMAVARYHAGPRNEQAQKQYICNVIRNMVASGLGAWTPSAKTFCEKQ